MEPENGWSWRLEPVNGLKDEARLLLQPPPGLRRSLLAAEERCIILDQNQHGKTHLMFALTVQIKLNKFLIVCIWFILSRDKPFLYPGWKYETRIALKYRNKTLFALIWRDTLGGNVAAAEDKLSVPLCVWWRQLLLHHSVYRTYY